MRGHRTLALIVTGIAVAGLAFAGCSPTGGGKGRSGGTASAGGADEASNVEVFTWWVAGTQKAGLDALIAVFERQYPDAVFVNGAAAGAGSTAKNQLRTRLQAGDPPDSFQVRAGRAVQDYVDAGQVEDIRALYDEFGIRDAFPKGLVDLLTDDGRIYSIPSSVHRANLVWANLAVLRAAGVSPRATYASPDEWFADLEKVKASGATALAVATTWTQVHLLETVLLAKLGADRYVGLWNGATDWAGADVTGALESFQKLISYTNTDRDGLDWPDATQMVVDANAGYTVMGDWAVTAFESAGAQLGTDFITFPVPGTDGVYDFLADSFTLPKGAPHPGGAKNWLAAVSSLDGQVAFNTVTGSIPARTDVDPSDFTEYQQGLIRSFARDTIVPSLAHGAAVPIAWLNAVSDATSRFTTGVSDLAKFQADLVAAATA